MALLKWRAINDHGDDETRCWDRHTAYAAGMCPPFDRGGRIGAISNDRSDRWIGLI